MLGDERALAADYQGERLGHFCSGRALARTLLARLGGPPAPILRGDSGEPLWPPGYTGSISHSGEVVAAVVDRRIHWRGMGLDVERIGRVTPELWPLMFGVAEQRVLRDASGVQRAYLATAFFAVKEAFLKLPSPRPGQVTDYRELEVACRRKRFTIRGESISLHSHFGCAALHADVFIEYPYLVACILLE